MKLVVVGAGMFVSGRGTESYGTVIPGLIQANRQYDITKVV